eukprot:355524-Chlamydomonas_euryale.AAC.31
MGRGSMLRRAAVRHMGSAAQYPCIGIHWSVRLDAAHLGPPQRPMHVARSCLAALWLDCLLRHSHACICCGAAKLPLQTCKLVHADLSEYNILYHNGELYIIDVSQAVDLDHPKYAARPVLVACQPRHQEICKTKFSHSAAVQALDFLREDCKHVNDYFRKQGIATLTVRELFDFAVDPTIDETNIDDALSRLMKIASRYVRVGPVPFILFSPSC